ncbi:MAG: hypothetical protein RLZZ127_505, partial [Planctomycetota bacterium]
AKAPAGLPRPVRPTTCLARMARKGWRAEAAPATVMGGWRGSRPLHTLVAPDGRRWPRMMTATELLHGAVAAAQAEPLG